MFRAKIPKPFQEEFIKWDLWFDVEVDEAELTWYIDGSLLDGPRELMSRTGAGFVAVLKGKLMAYGYAVPPSWISTIPGVEAWALCIILKNTVSRRAVITDCLGNVKMLERGKADAMNGKRPLARVWGPIFSSIEEETNNSDRWFDWMPAHTSKSAIGVAARASGRKVTVVDHRANFLVDGLAKKGANLHRVPEHIRKLVSTAEIAIEYAAAMVGVVGEASNNCITEKVRADGSICTITARDSTPMTGAMRKEDRRKAAEAVLARKAKIVEDVKAAKAARALKALDVRKRDNEDYMRRQELAKELFGDFVNHVPDQVQDQVQDDVQARLSEFETNSADEVDWDWNLTMPRAQSSHNVDVESLFDPDDSKVVSQRLVTRRLTKKTAVSGAFSTPESVGEPLGPTPVTRVRAESYRPAVRARTKSEVQGLGSSSTLSSQQQNSKKQNEKRSRQKAADKVTRVGVVPASGGVATEGRLLDSVAAFWERKKARSEATD